MMNSKLADVQNKLSESNQETEELKQSLSVAEENAAAAMALSKAAGNNLLCHRCLLLPW